MKEQATVMTPKMQGIVLVSLAARARGPGRPR